MIFFSVTAEWRYLKAEGIRIQREFGNHPSFLLMSLGNELWGSAKRLESILLDYRRKDDRHLYTDGSNNFQFAPVVLQNADFLCGVRLSEHRLYRGSYAACDGPQGFIQTDAPETVDCAAVLSILWTVERVPLLLTVRLSHEVPGTA